MHLSSSIHVILRLSPKLGLHSLFSSWNLNLDKNIIILFACIISYNGGKVANTTRPHFNQVLINPLPLTMKNILGFTMTLVGEYTCPLISPSFNIFQLMWFMWNKTHIIFKVVTIHVLSYAILNICSVTLWAPQARVTLK